MGSNPTPSAQAPSRDRRAAVAAAPTHVDVLIVGGGISGIGAAHHLRTQAPQRSFAILEQQDGWGGTWRTHRYPGIRSDSDLYTFGYRFKPWRGAPIASADEILRYLDEVIADDRLDDHVHFSHRVVRLEWCEADATWTATAVRGDGTTATFTAGFLWMCQGYYRHERGHTPAFEGLEDFCGQLVHPQQWPEDLDLEGKRVVVIGSGATAATLIPAIAGTCEHVTMLQRSPTFFITGRNHNELADLLRSLDVPEEWTHEIVRRKILQDMEFLEGVARDYPDLAREELLKPLRELVGDEAVERHFNPAYRPWQQRIAFVPDADLFCAIRDGQASVVTDSIVRFVEKGIELASGEVLEADVVITATGFDCNVLGDAEVLVDGVPFDFATSVTYRGMMFTGLPNMAWVFGYFRNSWTLRVDLLGDFVCRLLEHLDERGARVVEPVLPATLADRPRLPWVEPENFNPGYLMRALDLLPRQLDVAPWRHTQDYFSERTELPAADLDDGTLAYR